MDKKDISERIKEGLELRNMSQQELCNLTGISKGQMSSYVTGRYEPKQNNIYLISKALNVSPTWLMGYEVQKNEATAIPLIGQVAAGTPILAEQNIEDYFYLDTSMRADFCLKVKGDSMIDANIKDGDVAFFRHQSNLENGEIGAIIIDDEATLKRFYVDNGNIILQPENKNYPPIIISGGNVSIAGKLVAVLTIV